MTAAACFECLGRGWVARIVFIVVIEGPPVRTDRRAPCPRCGGSGREALK